MALQCFCGLNLQFWMTLLNARDELGQVAAEVFAHGEKVGNDDDLAKPGGRRVLNRGGEVRLGNIQEGGADAGEPAGFLDLLRQIMNAAIPLFHAAAMREDNDRYL